MAQTDSYVRGGQPRSVPDAIAEAYARMVAQQEAYNEKQEWGFELGQPTSLTSDGGRGNMCSSPDTADPELRRQQAEFKKVVDEVSKENAWMAIPALAPVIAVAGLEAAAAISGRLVTTAATKGPLVLTAKEPYLRVGDNWATRAGRRAHAALRAKVKAKPGWESEPAIELQSGGTGRPDVAAPVRASTEAGTARRNMMEMKPDTPTGRKAAEKAIKKYEGSDRKFRALRYNPKDYM